jgi:predicted transcriptional regulator
LIRIQNSQIENLLTIFSICISFCITIDARGDTMVISVRLDNETEILLEKTAKILNTTKTNVVKDSIQEYCRKKMDEKTKKPYDLIADLIGKERSGKGNLSMDHEKILRKAFSKKP